MPEEPLANGKRPDGTLRDTFRLPRGYWEAKDTRDDLLIEIRKKIAIGYPTTNTIFEDTRRAILYQNGKIALDIDLTRPDQLTDLLRQFFSYTEPDIATFEQAVDEFRQRIPDLAQGLLAAYQRGTRAKTDNLSTAFATFLALCRTSLDPDISRETVNEMLVQHLLTERLFRTIFNNPDFTRRNVIAAEIENVIAALTSRAFNRNDFERRSTVSTSPSRGRPAGWTDWTEKQHFLNTVYERFFQGFSVKQADTHGIVYTPQEIVDFMVASVDEVLHREFGPRSPRPVCKSSTRLPARATSSSTSCAASTGGTLAHKYAHDLFCNEIMLLPYYIACAQHRTRLLRTDRRIRALRGHLFCRHAGTLEGQQMELFSERNTERIQREKDAQIMVVIGNPPYNVGQKNENDNNKNRIYPVIDQRIRETYVKDSKATNRNALSDAYVKFFRWATDRLQGRDGIVCFVSNNGFLDGIAFDGIRKQLEEEFTHIYHLDLGGNARKHGGGNVFGIRVGVGITMLVRCSVNQTEKQPAVTIMLNSLMIKVVLKN